MDLIKGSDGYYVIVLGKLRKVKSVTYSPEFFRSTGGTASYQLEETDEDDSIVFDDVNIKSKKSI